MRADELMIGDWVSLFQGNCDSSPCNCKVNSISEYEIGIDGCDEYDYATLPLLFPIPLTPEILEKNGFHINGIPSIITSVKGIDDWSDDTYVWSRQETPDERMFVSVYMDTSADFFVEVYCQYCHADGIHVKYLHELQHALKLCGIGIEIKL